MKESARKADREGWRETGGGRLVEIKEQKEDPPLGAREPGGRETRKFARREGNGQTGEEKDETTGKTGLNEDLSFGYFITSAREKKTAGTHRPHDRPSAARTALGATCPSTH